MTDAKQITDYFASGYSCFWIVTQEPRRAVTILMDTFKNYVSPGGDKVIVKEWDCASSKTADPREPIDALCTKEKEQTVMFLKNYHWYIDKPPVVQKIQNSVESWQAKKKAIIIISPTVKIPPELEKDFLQMEFRLPDEKEIEDSVEFISEATGRAVKKPSGEHLNELITSCKGLSKLEIENSLALSARLHKKFDVEHIAKERCELIRSNSELDMIESKLTFDDIRGYEKIKEFLLSTALHPLAKGVLLMGPPGTGKTYLIMCFLGHLKYVLGKPRVCLMYDQGKMYSKFQGEADQNVRRAKAIIKALAPCVVVMDEFEKQFSGAGGSGDLDSGVTRRVTGAWLDFMQNRPEGVYMIGTCNSTRGIPPEYFRPGRWDTAPFFIDLPNSSEQLDILNYWAKKYSLVKKDLSEAVSDIPNMEKWTGAEIEAVCRIAKMRDCSLKSAAKFVLPQAMTMEEEIDKLRTWAQGRTIPASDIPEVDTKNKPMRKVAMSASTIQ